MRRNPTAAKPRVPTPNERVAWLERATRTRPSYSVEDAKRTIWMRNPVRAARIQRDFKWLQRQMKKLGQNPEDARFLY